MTATLRFLEIADIGANEDSCATAARVKADTAPIPVSKADFVNARLGASHQLGQTSGHVVSVDDISVGDAPDDQAALTIAVTDVNDPPTVDDICVTTQEDTLVSITLSGCDLDGDTLTYSVVKGPADGDFGDIVVFDIAQPEITGEFWFDFFGREYLNDIDVVLSANEVS